MKDGLLKVQSVMAGILTKFSAHFDDTRGFYLKQHEGKAYNKNNFK